MYKTYETITLKGESSRFSKRVLTYEGLKELVYDCVSKFNLISKDDVEFYGTALRDFHTCFEIHTELNFGTDARLSYKLNANRDFNFGNGMKMVLVENEISKKVLFYELEGKFDVNWATTIRSLSGASLCVELYNQMVSLGQMIETMLESYDIGYFKEINE